MVDEKLVPKLRFAGFTDNWEEITIKDYSTIKGRIGWRNLKQSEYTESGPYLIAGKHIHNGIINWDECDHLSVERYEESPEIALKKGDVIFSKDGSLGNPALIKELPSEATINGTMMLVRLNNKVSPNFFYQILNSDYFFRLLHILKSGSSIPHIFQRDMENFKFKIPNSYEEQNKISKFLENIDKKIELLEKKHNTYVNFKKYLMQQIFAQKLRFDFTAGWKEYKLKDLLTVKSSSISINQLEDNTGEYPLYGASGFLKNIDFCEMNRDYISIVKDGSGVGNLSYHEKNSSIVNTSQYLLPKKDFDITFLYYLLQTLNLLKYVNGSSIPHIYFKDYCIEKVDIPSLEEQQKIGKLLVNVDKTMENINKKINSTQEFKKGLLQQMFISCQKLIKKKIIEGKKIEFLILQNLCVSVFFLVFLNMIFPFLHLN